MAKGRPREFDADEALERAMRVFWSKGYEGTTLPDLTEAMGINRPSLYAAFGNKEELFRRVLDRYAEGPSSYVCRSLLEPTARAVVERLLAGVIDLKSAPENPRGCLGVQELLACGEAAEAVRRDIVSRQEAARDALRQRFARAVAEGDLPPEADPADLARYVSTILQGLSIQAAAGATPDELRRVAAMALRAWPGGVAEAS